MDKKQLAYFILEIERYCKNSIQTMSNSPIDGKYYTDIKYTSVATGTLYLAYLHTLDSFLYLKNIFPKERENKLFYENNFAKIPELPNLKSEFKFMYNKLHIERYYNSKNNLFLVEDWKKCKQIFKNSLEQLKKKAKSLN